MNLFLFSMVAHCLSPYLALLVWKTREYDLNHRSRIQNDTRIRNGFGEELEGNLGLVGDLGVGENLREERGFYGFRFRNLSRKFGEFRFSSHQLRYLS